MSKTSGKEFLWSALSDCRRFLDIREEDWGPVLSALRITSTLGKAAAMLREHGLLQKLPIAVRVQLEEHLLLVERNQTNLRFEVDRLVRVLRPGDTQIVLLKGCAYLFSDLRVSYGRFSSDVDILVPKSEIREVEAELLAAGWEKAKLTPYDERYYREWMHEIPPLWHPARQVAVDIHHTISPLTSRFQPDANALLARSVSIPGPNPGKGLRVLSPADMVLHSALHLFNEEFLLGLRDLTDLRDLLEYFAKEPSFWDDLASSARHHGLERVLFYLLRYCNRILAADLNAAPKTLFAIGRPPLLTRYLMDILAHHAFSALNGPFSSRARPYAMWLLYVRSHWLKMPPLLLLKHLLVKSWRRWGTMNKAASSKV